MCIIKLNDLNLKKMKKKLRYCGGERCRRIFSLANNQMGRENFSRMWIHRIPFPRFLLLVWGGRGNKLASLFHERKTPNTKKGSEGSTVEKKKQK